VPEDLSDLEPGGARRLDDRQIAAAWDQAASDPGPWIELYREMLRLGESTLRELDAQSSAEPSDASPDQRLIAAERRRLRARFRFWVETIGRGSLPAMGA
jgi:hypothetical protein